MQQVQGRSARNGTGSTIAEQLGAVDYQIWRWPALGHVGKAGIPMIWRGIFVDVESTPGQGTTFSIYLSLPQDESAVVELKGETDGDRSDGFRGRGEMILFVDDEEQQLRLMRDFLQNEGYRVLVARDGAEAVEMYARHKEEIAVVVLDFGLPKLNGWHAFQRMRQIDPHLNALFATGFLSSEIQEEMKKNQLGGVLDKPYQLDEVLEKISAAIRKPAELESL